MLCRWWSCVSSRRAVGTRPCCSALAIRCRIGAVAECATSVPPDHTPFCRCAQGSSSHRQMRQQRTLSSALLHSPQASARVSIGKCVPSGRKRERLELTAAGCACSRKRPSEADLLLLRPGLKQPQADAPAAHAIKCPAAQSAGKRLRKHRESVPIGNPCQVEEDMSFTCCALERRDHQVAAMPQVITRGRGYHSEAAPLGRVSGR
jgi:hypothetical protein